MNAAIDIGTNSIKLLIGDILSEGKLEKIFYTLRYTRLGERILKENILSPQAIDRTLLALEELKKLADEFGAGKIGAFATESVRIAKNKEEFLLEAQRILGGSITVLTPSQEAKLSRTGALLNIKNCSDDSVVIDVGGGSSEIAGPSFNMSTPLGHITITDIFLETDPPLSEEIKSAENYIFEILNKISIPDLPVNSNLIGVGGTAVCLAMLNHLKKDYPPKSVHGECLDIKKIKDMTYWLLGLNREERMNKTGFPLRRSDVLPAGGLILKNIMEKLNAGELCVSELGLLAGILAKENELYNSFWSL